MKKALIAFIIISLPFLSFSQTSQQLTGKWKFRDALHPEKLDSTGLKGIRRVFSTMTIYLKPNKHYKSFFITKDEGSWKFDSIAKSMVMTSNKGTGSQMGVVSCTD